MTSPTRIKFAEILSSLERAETIRRKNRLRLAALLNRWRKARGLSIQELADRIGTSKGRLGDIIRLACPLSNKMARLVLREMRK